MKNLLTLSFLLLIFFTFPQDISGQNAPPTLKVKDYQQWKSLPGSNWLSEDGQWLAYRVVLVNENDTLYINTLTQFVGNNNRT